MVSDIIKLYGSLFQDEHSQWLECGQVANIQICRCLDAIQLDLALLWINKPRTIYKFYFDCATPYNVGVYADMRSECNKNISWCSHTIPSQKGKDLKLVSSSRLQNSTLNEAFGYEGLNLTEQGCSLLFALLCLYTVNTTMQQGKLTNPTIQREALTEFYFCSCPRAFCTYISSFCEGLSNGSDYLKRVYEHIKMINKVISWYANSDLNKEKALQQIEKSLFEPIRTRVVCIDVLASPLCIQNLCNLLYSKCLEPLKKNTLPLNVQLINNIYNIFRTIKDPNNKLDWQIISPELNDIYNSLKQMIESSQRSSEPKLMKALETLYNLIQ